MSGEYLNGNITEDALCPRYVPAADKGKALWRRSAMTGSPVAVEALVQGASDVRVVQVADTHASSHPAAYIASAPSSSSIAGAVALDGEASFVAWSLDAQEQALTVRQVGPRAIAMPNGECGMPTSGGGVMQSLSATAVSRLLLHRLGATAQRAAVRFRTSLLAAIALQPNASRVI